MTRLASIRRDHTPSVPRHLELDAAAVAQTKQQISQLVADIAALIGHCETPDAFYSAMLTRLVAAMAGTGAAVWRYEEDDGWVLVQSCLLPDALWIIEDPDSKSETAGGSGGRPTPEHEAILRCVALEKQPVLVPPGDIAAGSDRPINPLQQCLIYSPVPVELHLGRYWLQVVQPPSGGIATQRGYLRFVAQIADLTADFIKTHRLREIERERQLYHLTQRTLEAAATAGRAEEKLVQLVEAIQQMVGCDQVALMSRASLAHRWQANCITGLRDHDGRSEGSRLLSEMAAWLSPQAASAPTASLQPIEVAAVDRRQEVDADELDPRRSHPTMLRFAELFSAAHCAWLPLHQGGYQGSLGVGCLVYWSWKTTLPELPARAKALHRGLELGRLGLRALDAPSLRRAMRQSVTPHRSSWQLVQAAVGSTIGKIAIGTVLATGIGLIPVPLKIVAPATLQPMVQARHYAPSDARIVRVHVDYGDPVQAGQLLIELEDDALNRLYEEATSQRLRSQERRRDLEARLLRSEGLTLEQRQELEGELETLRRLASSEQERVDALDKQLDRLKIRAAHSGIVATWDARRVLADRPVRAGQSLLTIHQPDGDWCIEAQIPQRKVGSFLQLSDRGPITAACFLSSHPTCKLPAIYQPFSQPAIPRVHGESPEQAAMLVRFAVSDHELPQKNAGSSARIAIETGTGPLAWSVFGDALTSLWAKVRLWI